MRTAMLAAAAVLALPASASANGSVSFDGSTIRVTEAVPNEVNQLTVAMQDQGVIEISDTGEVIAGSGCEPSEREPNTALCPLGDGGIDVSLGGGNDFFGTYWSSSISKPADGAVRVDLGAGDDRAYADEIGQRVQGGPGNDTLGGGDRDDVLEGGPGDDKLSGGAGADVLRGDDGNDHIEADPYSNKGIFPDVIDGGAGVDELVDYRADGGEAEAPPIDVRLDGQGNDGRAGENDNVLGVERIESYSAGTFVGDDGANVFIAPEVGRSGNYSGGGGDDRLYAGDANGDQLDGGAGNDELSGGFGDDVLTGGPGQDVIAADRPLRCNEVHCDIGGGGGNDVVQARDGEVDSVSCGPGTDKVVADADDVVAADCETVERSGGTTPGPGDGPGNGPGTTTKVTAKLSGTSSLRKALKNGVTVKVAGATAGARIKGTLLRKRKTVASGSAKANAKGQATVKVRFTRTARKQLKRTRRVKLTLKITGAANRTITVGRR